MTDFVVRSLWPDGDVEWFETDNATEARAWAEDARRESGCRAAVYGVLTREIPEHEWERRDAAGVRGMELASQRSSGGPVGIYAGRGAGMPYCQPRRGMGRRAGKETCPPVRYCDQPCDSLWGGPRNSPTRREEAVVRGGMVRVMPGARALFLLLCCLALSACGTRREGVADLEIYPQIAALYVAPGEAGKAPLLSSDEQDALFQRFVNRFFTPWQMRAASLPVDEAFWGTRTFGTRKGYGENLQPWSLARWEALVAKQMAASYPSMARRAIVTRNADFRVMPTDKPFFYSPGQAGEGYPFDYMQNSAVWQGTPVLVTHGSADGAWLFAEAGHVAGWLPADSVGWVDDAFAAAYRTGTYVAVVRDGVTLYAPPVSTGKLPAGSPGVFAGTAHIGAVFPVAEARDAGQAMEESGWDVFLPARAVTGEAVLVRTTLSGETARRMPLPLSQAMVARIADQMMGQPYGWGGLLANRDCSAAMRDMFTPFGVWLPRNSSQQGMRGGTLIPLEGETTSEKRNSILQRGVPFYSFIWFTGHIGLYLGPDPISGEPLLLHSVWGARTNWRGEEGRAVVGRMAITTLRMAEERADVQADWFYRRIKGLTLLPYAPASGSGRTP